jgi:RimJ/RimL family protein N-acetyltransferase
MGAAGNGERETNLKDGTIVVLRAIRPEDRESLRRFYNRLSQETIFQRFFGPYPDLDEERARYFTEVDGKERFALVALHPEEPGEIIGVVRYERDEDADYRAEYAAVVEDEWQGRGLGTQLTRALLDEARQRGITTLHAMVRPDNRRMVRVLQGLGLPELVRYENGIERFEIDISDD